MHVYHQHVQASCGGDQDQSSPSSLAGGTMTNNPGLFVAPTLPWLRDVGSLPAPLPTVSEIENTTTQLPSIFDPSIRRTVLIQERFVVKYGPLVFENEGHALLLVEQLPDVPAPRLYAMYRDADRLFLIMEYIPGQQLSEIWSALSESEKLPIIRQLRLASESLRAVPSPGSFSSTSGGPIPHRYFFSPEHDYRITGPFQSEHEFIQGLILCSKKNWEEWGRHGWMTDFFTRHLDTAVGRHGKSVFTHSDFQRKNILVREEPLAASGDGGTAPARSFRVVALLDWESAGWYPEYWEYSLCFTYFCWDDDWPENVESILDPYVREAALMRMIGQDLDL